MSATSSSIQSPSFVTHVYDRTVCDVEPIAEERGSYRVFHSHISRKEFEDRVNNNKITTSELETLYKCILADNNHFKYRAKSLNRLEDKRQQYVYSQGQGEDTLFLERVKSAIDKMKQ